jgi:HAD superfamily hydrolase (TIGR01662 family)
MNKKLIFLDMDKTLIHNIVKPEEPFPIAIWDMTWMRDVWNCLKYCVKEFGIEELVIVTNQGGISRFVNRERFISKLQYVTDSLFEFCVNNQNSLKFKVQGLFYDPEKSPKNWRKPDTGMLEEVFNEVGRTSLHKSDCLMIGDASDKNVDFSDSDKMTAVNFGIDYLDVDDFVAQFLPLIEKDYFKEV